MGYIFCSKRRPSYDSHQCWLNEGAGTAKALSAPSSHNGSCSGTFLPSPCCFCCSCVTAFTTTLFIISPPTTSLLPLTPYFPPPVPAFSPSSVLILVVIISCDLSQCLSVFGFRELPFKKKHTKKTTLSTLNFGLSANLGSSSGFTWPTWAYIFYLHSRPMIRMRHI